MQLVMTLLFVEIFSNTGTLSWDLEKVLNLFGTVKVYPRFLSISVGNFSGFKSLASMELSEGTYVQGYDTKFHMKGGKKVYWPFLGTVFKNMRKDPPYCSRKMFEGALETEKQMADYLRSCRNGSGARIEIVLNYQHKKLDYIKERIELAFKKMKEVTQANELSVQCPDSYHEIVLSLRPPSNCSCIISPRLFLKRAFDRDILVNKFLDSTLHKDLNFESMCYRSEQQDILRVDLHSGDDFDVKKVCELMPVPYSEFKNHLKCIFQIRLGFGVTNGWHY